MADTIIPNDPAEQPVEWTDEMNSVLKEGEPEVAAPPKGRDGKGRFAPKAEMAAEPEQEETPGESASAADAGSEQISAAVESEPEGGLDADEIALAKAYGLTDDELAGMDSATLARAIAPFERHALAQHKASAETQEPAPPPQPEAKAPPERPKEPEKKPEPKADDDAELELLTDGLDDYGDEIKGAFSKLVGHLKSERAARAAMAERMEHLLHRESQAAQEHQYQAFLQTFDAIVNSLDEEEKFGPEDWNQRTPEQWKAREALRQATQTYGESLNKQGKQPPLNRATIKRAALIAFPEEITKQEIAKVHGKLASQSKKRTGRPSAPKSVAIAGDPSTDPESMAQFQRIWNEMERENGTVGAR